LKDQLGRSGDEKDEALAKLKNLVDSKEAETDESKKNLAAAEEASRKLEEEVKGLLEKLKISGEELAVARAGTNVIKLLRPLFINKLEFFPWEASLASSKVCG
jgi:hypothetical protein